MMNNINLDLENNKLEILENEYKTLTEIFVKMQTTIIENENILLYSKPQTMKLLNELIKNMNETYNKTIMELYSKENDKPIVNNESLYGDITEKNNSESNTSTNSSNKNSTIKITEKDLLKKEIKSKTKTKNNFNTNTYSKKLNTKIENNKKKIYSIKMINELKSVIDDSTIKFYNNDLVELIKFNPFKEIKNKITLLGKIVGFTNMNDILYLNFGSYIKFLKQNNNNKKLYKMLNEIFVPLDYEIINNNNKIETIIIKKIQTNKYLTIFNNECSLSIQFYNKTINFTGYIKTDPLNVYMRTSQIANNFLYLKKNKIENIIKCIKTNNRDKIINNEIYNKINDIDINFAENYFKNMTIVDILLINEEYFINKLIEDYNIFIELNKIHLVKLIKQFTKNANENLYSMFNTIKLLLLGSEENCSIASLLFNLLKDKKNSNCNEFISNIIYEQLNYISQLKLKKSSINIKNELEKLKAISTNDIDLKKQVLLSKNMPDTIKKICLEKLEELKNSNNETYKIKLYVNILVQFPWPCDIDDNIFKIISTDKNKSKDFLENIETKLNEQVYGHKLAKTKTLQMLAKLISVQGSNIQPIALAGPPGVGKTKFAQCLAECLDIPFVQITLGGQNDGELLHGHGYTYSGAQPGLIVKKMVDAGSARCIMYFDELDKCASKNGQINELMSILIHLTDPMTNGSFQDRFFQEITFPLNKVIFIFSFNDANKIDKILLDRMEILEINSYNLKEKMAIANDYLLKQICKDVGFNYNSIIFNKDILTHIIENYTYEPGVRSLKRSLENILLKLNIDKIYQRGLFINNINYTVENPLIITKDIIKEFLGDIKIEYSCIHSRDSVGIVNGLYATESCSGGIVPIQITANNFGNNKKFILKLTGNQKKIMKESIIYSFTAAINLLNFEAKEIFFNKYPNGLHIHTPEAATPKDGPSAGVAFTLAFLSIMLNLKIRRDIALTGEIDLYGYVKKIGGVRYKVQGGFKAGVKKIYLPSENKDDYNKLFDEMREIFDDEHTCEFIEHVIDVAKFSLIDWNTKKDFINFNY